MAVPNISLVWIFAIISFGQGTASFAEGWDRSPWRGKRFAECAALLSILEGPKGETAISFADGKTTADFIAEFTFASTAREGSKWTEEYIDERRTYWLNAESTIENTMELGEHLAFCAKVTKTGDGSYIVVP